MSIRYKSSALWLPTFILLLAISFLTINNAIQLPFHDRARDIVTFNEHDVALDSKGNEVKNWQANNTVDDAIKVVFVIGTFYSFWMLLSIFVHRLWIKIVVTIVVTIALLPAAYILSFDLYYQF